MSDTRIVLWFYAVSWLPTFGLAAMLYLCICKVEPLWCRGMSEEGIARQVGFHPGPFIRELRRNYRRYFQPCCYGGWPGQRTCGRAEHIRVPTYGYLVSLIIRVHVRVALVIMLTCALLLLIRHL
jgi:hypothetical protein